jgi:glutathione S-transferase
MKEWYALLKSRPSFRPILEDRIAGFAPPEYYSDPDF